MVQLLKDVLRDQPEVLIIFGFLLAVSMNYIRLLIKYLLNHSRRIKRFESGLEYRLLSAENTALLNCLSALVMADGDIEEYRRFLEERMLKGLAKDPLEYPFYAGSYSILQYHDQRFKTNSLELMLKELVKELSIHDNEQGICDLLLYFKEKMDSPELYPHEKEKFEKAYTIGCKLKVYYPG